MKYIVEFKNWLLNENKSIDVYHVTYYANLENIATYGLNFQISNRNYQKPHLVQNSSQGTFFVNNVQGVKYWISTLEDQANDKSDNIYQDGLIPIILKFKLNKNKHLIDPFGETDFDRKTKTIIPPQGILAWNAINWIPIQSFESINLNYFVEFSDDPDDEHLAFIRSPYQKPINVIKKIGLNSMTGGYPLPNH